MSRFDRAPDSFPRGGAQTGRRWTEIEKMKKKGTVPSVDRISSIESVAASGAKWTVPDFFTVPEQSVPLNSIHGSRTTYPTVTYPGGTNPSRKRSAGLEETCGLLPAREFVRPSRLVCISHHLAWRSA